MALDPATLLDPTQGNITTTVNPGTINVGILNTNQAPQSKITPLPNQPNTQSMLAGLGNLLSQASQAYKQSQIAKQASSTTTPINAQYANMDISPSSQLSGMATSNIIPSQLKGTTMSDESSDNYSIPNIVAAAKATYPNNPVMAQLSAAQAIEESGLSSGKPSGLALKNNLFGIKGSGTAGSVVMPTTEYINGQPRKIPQGFAANNSIQDSFQQHANLMAHPRYQNVGTAGNLEDAAKAVQAAGYATDPNYSKNLIATYNNVLAPYFEQQS